jgi:hypothetical protein
MFFLRMTITCHNWFTIFLEHLIRLKNHPIIVGQYCVGNFDTHTILAQTLKQTHMVP